MRKNLCAKCRCALIEEEFMSFNKACLYLEICDHVLTKYIIRDENNKSPEQVIPIRWNLPRTKMKLRREDLDTFRIWYITNVLNKEVVKNG